MLQRYFFPFRFLASISSCSKWYSWIFLSTTFTRTFFFIKLKSPFSFLAPVPPTYDALLNPTFTVACVGLLGKLLSSYISTSFCLSYELVISLLAQSKVFLTWSSRFLIWLEVIPVLKKSMSILLGSSQYWMS